MVEPAPCPVVTMAKMPTLVCVVDDDSDILSALTFSLGIEGFDVRGYQSGEAALRALEAPASTAPGCWVIDYRLPKMDGLDLAVTLREAAPQVPVILMTSNPSASVRARSAVMSIPIVEKPLLNDSLGDAIRHALAGR